MDGHSLYLVILNNVASYFFNMLLWNFDSTAGRRRRRLRSSFANGKKFRGLFYKEDEFKDDEMSMFASNPQ